MNFTQCPLETGTSLRGYVETTYNELIAAFGDPNIQGMDKSQAVWSLQFDDGTYARVYDYKSSLPPHEVTIWHIGGTSDDAVTCVVEHLPASRFEYVN